MIAATLAMLAAPAAQANICREKTPGPVGAARDELLPRWDFIEAYQLYQEARDGATREALQTELRFFVEYHAQIIHERHLEYAWAQAFDPGFIALYEDAIDWGRALCEPGGEKAYAEHIAYLARPDETSQQFALSLKSLAASLGHPRARFEFAVAAVDDDVPRRRRIGFGTLHDLAGMDYLPAQKTIADLYSEGRVVRRDRARAYYWYIRAQRGGADVDDRLAVLEAELQPEERARADDWLSSGKVPWIN